jgi:hypothetical protein
MKILCSEGNARARQHQRNREDRRGGAGPHCQKLHIWTPAARGFIASMKG